MQAASCGFGFGKKASNVAPFVSPARKRKIPWMGRECPFRPFRHLPPGFPGSQEGFFLYPFLKYHE